MTAGKWNNAILAVLSVINANLAAMKINVRQPNIDEFAYPDCGIHERLNNQCPEV